MSTNPTPPPLHPTKPRTTKRKPTTTIITTTATTTTTTIITTLIPTITSAISAAHSFLLTHDLHLLPSHTHSLQSSLLSSSLLLSKLQSLLQIQQPHIPISPPFHPHSWFQRLLSSTDDDSMWVPLFRTSKPTFFTLDSALSESLTLLVPSISSHFALGVALYRLAHNGSFSFVGKRFGVSSSDACRCFYSVCRLICENLLGYFGDFGSDMGKILMGFEGFLLPNCCGVLGVEKFNIEGELLGQNGFIFVQALVDSNGYFMDLSCGWPSTFEPGSILPQTRLYSAVQGSKELLNGSSYELVDGSSLPQYILGDSCYPLLPWLVTPYVELDNLSLSPIETEFNEVHRRAMGLVRMAFRRVRANWQLLNRKWNEELVEFLPFIITTCCLLNNFLMKHGEIMPDVGSGLGGEIEFPAFVGEVDESSRRTRDLLASYHSRVSQSI